jgi:protein associated with RNAse G/E
MSTDITVRVLKYNGIEYRRWNARIKSRVKELIILNAEFEDEVQHASLGTIPKGTRTIEYYWLDRWYNIFQFLKADGSTRIWYCNINTPPELINGELSYIDLDVDILVQPDLSYQVMDLDEFEENAKRYGYSEQVKKRAFKAVDELVSMIEAVRFPFARNVLKSSVTSAVNLS